MNKRVGVVLVLAAAALFLILNRAAYNGYFQDDDLDTLSWIRSIPSSTYSKGLVTPWFYANNFRPVAHLYYYAMEKGFGLDFPVYLIPLHALHLLNIWLLWLFARKLGLSALAASAGAFFFGFHAALFDAWWKPMYVFDIVCTALCLASLLLYARNRWILSLIAFWLAYKSKELAIMLPAVLAGYELLLGEKRWKQLVPFFVVSAWFGVQALAHQPAPDPTYTLRLAPASQAATIGFYSSQLFFLPLAGMALVALPFVVRDRRLWFGLAAMCLFLVPLLLLPERLFAVYWYLPLTGAALVVAALASGPYRATAAVFLALWIPWDFVHFRASRRFNEPRERQNRLYVSDLLRFARSSPDRRLFVYDGLPEGFERWGIQGALTYSHQRQDVQVMRIQEPGARKLIDDGDAIWLQWDRSAQKLYIVRYPPAR